MNELDFIFGCKENDPKSQRLLFEKYAPRMLSICRRYVTDFETAQDLLQEGFIKVFTKIETYSGEGSFAGWMQRIFVTTSLEYLRRNNMMKDRISIDECENIEDEIHPSVLSKLTTDDLLECIRQLPSGYRTVFNLYAIEGYSHSEIAKMLSISESSSQSQLVRARKILQRNVQCVIEKNKNYA